MKWDYKIIAMIVYKNIFTKIFATLIAAVFVVPAFAASDNGCGDDENNRIVPVLALCSSHTYNIGLPYNPTTDSDKQLMRDVVAMKSTIMMQQMYCRPPAPPVGTAVHLPRPVPRTEMYTLSGHQIVIMPPPQPMFLHACVIIII